MTGSVALDVVIGLAFVYTLYSLLTTTITEFIATWIRLRPRFLIIGIQRMLDDGSGTKVFSDIFMNQPLIRYLVSGWAWFNKAPAYMSASNFSKNLLETLKAAYPAGAMTKIVEIIRERIIKKLDDKTVAGKIDDQKKKDLIKQIEKLKKKQIDENDIEEVNKILTSLQELTNAASIQISVEESEIRKFLKEIEDHLQRKPVDRIQDVLRSPNNIIGTSETVKHIRSLFRDSNGDLEKFRTYLEQWYDDTMERVTGWYKKWIQVITFFVGLAIAIFFNADTILIVGVLSKDPDARKEIVQMATAYIESHPAPPPSDTSDTAKATRQKLDSLLAVTKDIRKDAESANSVLGTGWDSYPDSIQLITASERDLKIKTSKEKLSNSQFFELYITKDDCMPRYVELNDVLTEKTITRLLDLDNGRRGPVVADLAEGKRKGKTKDKNHDYATVSVFNFIWTGFWGYFLTAIALSLGAPFWFDMLNKLVKLRTSVQSAPSETSRQADPAATTTQVSITKRVG